MLVLELRHVVLEHPHLLDERRSVANELARLAAESADPVALARALVFRGKDYLEAGNVGPALADYARAQAVADKHAVAPILLALAYAGTLALIARGQFADAEDAATRAYALHHNTTLPGSAELPVVVGTVLHLVRGTVGTIEPMLAHAATGDTSGAFTELHALALLRTNRAEEAIERLGPWQDQPEIPQDLLWLVRMTIRATLWSELAPTEMVHALFHQLLPYADRIAIAGTGIAILGNVSHPLDLLARANGDLDEAVTHLTRALTAHQNAGFRAFAASTAHELAVTLEHRAKSGDAAQAAWTRSWAEAEASTLGITLSRH